MLGKLESIWRYPVKSMRGEEVDEIFVAFTGLMGDRVYAVFLDRGPEGLSLAYGPRAGRLCALPGPASSSATEP